MPIHEELAERRDLYFSRYYRILVHLALFLLVIASLEILYMVYWTLRLPDVRFFVTTSNGDLMALVPAEAPQEAQLARSYIFEG